MEGEIPIGFEDRIGYGLYGGAVQYYIKGVDGAVAQLGDELPGPIQLKSWIESADREHLKIVAHYERRGE